MSRVVLVSAIVLALGCGPSEPAGFVGELLSAERGARDTPLLSAAEPGADLERAYEVQRAFVTERFGGGIIGGYKAGLATPTAQARFGIDEPVAGVLPILGRLEGSPRLDPSSFRRLLVELEFAFEIGAHLNQPVDDLASLREVVRAVRPAVELPDVGFPTLDGVRVEDLVAANVAASYYLVGAARSPGDVELGTLHATLSRDGEELVAFRGEAAELAPWESLRWLVNDRLARGWPVREGQILIAGALAPPVDGDPGRYEADFGELGALRFEIAEP